MARVCSRSYSFDKEFKPVLQVINYKNFVLTLSDGSHFTFSILYKKLEELVNSSRLQKGSIVKLANFFVKEHQNTKVIIIIDLDLILEECELIGEPVPLSIYAPSLPNMADLSIS